MNERLQQLEQITRMCLNELQQAQENFQRYAYNIKMMANEMNTVWRDFDCFLTEYDSFLTNITLIMDAARKFNIKVNLCDMKLTEAHNLSKNNQRNTEQNCSGYTEAPKSIFFPAEEYNLDTETYDNFVYPTLNLNEIYKPNDIISGAVTFVKSSKDLSFFIFDYNSKYCSVVVELSKSLGLRQYNKLPMISEIFGCTLDNHIFRAVLSSKSFYDDEMDEEILPCYLLDTGEILPLKEDFVMYKLTDEQKTIPALALPCQLVTTNRNPFKNPNANEIKDIEYKKCNFKIIAIENNTLKVVVLDNFNTVSDAYTVKNETNELKLNKTSKLQLTEEELEMINEEPLNTSNAMKAVMGYDPQDDKRICRFYDPTTGGCFKGVNCRLEHTLRQPEGWTKDILPVSSIIDNRTPLQMFTPDSIINITPTYVGKLDRFYAQINEPNKIFQPLVWNDEDIPSWRLLRKPPLMLELVLCRYVDGLWYRAKIMSHDDDYKTFEVLYVDYGNAQVVNLRDIAAIDKKMAAIPFQAVLCRLDNVNEKSSISSEERKNCLEILCEMILNKTMDVKVISHYEDLFISFEDKETYPLPDMLIEIGVLNQNEDTILL